MKTSEPKEQYSKYTIKNFYSDNDLAKQAIFKGDFINFGYWKGIAVSPSRKISVEARIKSSERLYRIVLDRLRITRSDRVLEVGCGKGMGLSIIAGDYEPRSAIGMDLFVKQVKRAKSLHADLLKVNPSLDFKVGRAEKMPFTAGQFTKIYSVEAAQHFLSFRKFAEEAFRVLAKNGIICVTTFFSNTEDGEKKMEPLFPTIRDSADRFRFVDEVLNDFRHAGFKDIKFSKIGQYVFKGWDIWMAQNGYHKSWGRNWLKAYKMGLIDYYVIAAKKGSKYETSAQTY